VQIGDFFDSAGSDGATGEASIAIGYGAWASGEGSLALGWTAQATDPFSIALSNGNTGLPAFSATTNQLYFSGQTASAMSGNWSFQGNNITNVGGSTGSNGGSLNVAQGGNSYAINATGSSLFSVPSANYTQSVIRTVQPNENFDNISFYNAKYDSSLTQPFGFYLHDTGEGVFYLSPTSGITPEQVDSQMEFNLMRDNSFRFWNDSDDPTTRVVIGTAVSDGVSSLEVYQGSNTGYAINATGKVAIGDGTNIHATISEEGDITANSFSGDGSGLTGVPGSALMGGATSYIQNVGTSALPAFSVSSGTVAGQFTASTATITNTLYANTFNVKTLSTGTSYQILSTDYILVITNSAITTVTLPSSPATGMVCIIKDGTGNAATSNITISGGTIDSGSSLVMNQPWQSVMLVFNGTKWNNL
jgi:hypothetical protein